METVKDFILFGSKITADGGCSHEIKRGLLLRRKAMTNLDSILKSRHYFAYKIRIVKATGFSSSHVWMWESDHKEGWALKNWRVWTVVLEKTLESPLDSKEIKPVIPKGNWSWIFHLGSPSRMRTYWLPCQCSHDVFGLGLFPSIATIAIVQHNKGDPTTAQVLHIALTFFS